MLRIALTLALVATAYLTRTVRLAAFEQHVRSQRYEDIYYLPPREWLPVMSLGYKAALADLLWCRSLVYFGEELGQHGKAGNVFNYSDAILELDPDFKAAYQWAATGALYRPTVPSLEDGRRGLVYLERAVSKWPNDGKLRWDLGSYLRFNLLPLEKDPVQRRKLQEEAVTHLHIAMLKGAGPAWLSLNNASLLAKLGKKEAAIAQLEEVYATVDDEETRWQIADRLNKMRAETNTTAMKAVVDDFESKKAGSFPYVSGDLFFLVGPKLGDSYWHDVADLFAPADLADDGPLELSASESASTTVP